MKRVVIKLEDLLGRPACSNAAGGEISAASDKQKDDCGLKGKSK